MNKPSKVDNPSKVDITCFCCRFYLQFDTVRSTDIYRDYIALDDISFSEGCLFEGNNAIVRLSSLFTYYVTM